MRIFIMLIYFIIPTVFKFLEDKPVDTMGYITLSTCIILVYIDQAFVDFQKTMKEH